MYTLLMTTGEYSTGTRPDRIRGLLEGEKKGLWWWAAVKGSERKCLAIRAMWNPISPPRNWLELWFNSRSTAPCKRPTSNLSLCEITFEKKTASVRVTLIQLVVRCRLIWIQLLVVCAPPSLLLKDSAKDFVSPCNPYKWRRTFSPDILCIRRI